MMKRTTLCSLVALLALATIPSTLADTKTDPAEWVPADAVIYVGVTDVERTWENFKKTAGYRLMNDEAVAKAIPAMNIIGTAFEKLQERVAQALGVQAEQLKNPFKGPLAVYIQAVPGAPDNMQPSLVAGVGDAELMKTYYETAVNKLKEHAKRETVSAGSATIEVFTTSREDEDEDEDKSNDFDDFDEGMSPLGALGGGSPEEMIEKALDGLFSADSLPPTLALCLTADRLIVAGSAEQVKGILRSEKRSRSLADTEDYKALLRHLKPVGNVHMLFNVPRIIELAKENTDKSDLEGLHEVLKIIGVESLRSVVGHLRLGATSYDSKMELLFLMGSQRSGVAEILCMENCPTAPPASVSADACLYAGINLDPPKLIDQIERMLRQNDPETADEMQATLQSMPMPDGETISFRQEFLNHLTGPLSMSLSATKPFAPDAIRLLVALGQRDQAAMVRFFGHLAPMLQAQELRGTQVFGSMMAPGMVLAPTTDRIIVGSMASIETALQPAGGDQLAQTPTWRRAQRFVPEKAWFTLYVDNRKMMEAALELAKNREQLMASPAAMNPGVMLLMEMAKGMTEWLADSDLDNARRVLQYCAHQIVTVSTTDEGVRLTAVKLKPEQ